MLFYIPYSKDKNFKIFVEEYIKKAYWPEERYKKEKFKGWTKRPKDTQIIDKLKKRMSEISQKVCNEENLYIKTKGIDGQKDKGMKLPFMDWFHRLFMERKYDFPYRDPEDDKDNLLRLKPSGAKKENYSKNEGNYHHFINVVMASARIIKYFTDKNNISKLFSSPGNISPDEVAYFRDNIHYQDSPDIRTFKLMLASFYHDIGKTIVDHRHGMEGSFIIADHTTRSLSQLDTIAKSYPTPSPPTQPATHKENTFEREDLLEISTFLYYHDSFGTLGTGESSYTLLTDMIDRIKRNCLRYQGTRADQKRYCNMALFDLWTLNIADIIVSMKDKFKFQPEWEEESKSIKLIKEFVESEGGQNRIHDLRVALQLLQKHNEGTHRDDTIELEEMAQREARAHTVERIRRLVCSSLQVAIIQFIEKDTENAKTRVMTDVMNNIMTTDGGLGKYTLSFPPGVLHSIIFRNIESLSDPKEFYKRLAWIVSMDYALGFFLKIAYRAIETVNAELNNTGCVTGWIRSKNASPHEDPEEIKKAHGMFFIDNYCAIVVRMLGHLLFRERSIDQPSNIEFEDARNRLIDEKIDKIIGLEGPYRQNRAIELILKTVFVY
jgi:hypothetical protein